MASLFTGLRPKNLLRRLVLRRLFRRPPHGNRVSQPEGNYRLRRNRQFLVAGKRRTRCTGAGTNQTADQCTFTAAGESANQSAGSGSTTSHNCRPLALAFDGLGIGGTLNRGRNTTHVDRGQRDRQRSLALKPARRLRIDHGSGHARARRDSNHTIHCHGMRQHSRKGVAWVRHFCVDGLAYPYHQTCACRNHQWRRRRWWWRLGHLRLRLGWRHLLRLLGRRHLLLRRLRRSRGGLLIWRGRIGLRRGARRLISLGRRRSVVRHRRLVLALVLLAAGSETYHENCTKHER